MSGAPGLTLPGHRPHLLRAIATPRPAMLIFRPLFDPASSTWTYLLGDRDSGQALLIDPVWEQVPRDLALIGELGLHLVASLDTHVHADHVTGAWRLQQRTGCRIGLAAVAGVEGVDLPLQHGDRVGFGPRHLAVRATPGHTDGCLSFVLDDQSRAFTGDCLLIRGCGRTDFQQGSATRLFRSAHEQLLSLPEDCLLYPGHDYRGLTVTSVAEERRWNPRLGGGADEADFTGYMNHLGLPHPKQMAVALPANLRCGRRVEDAAGGESAKADAGDWAPLTLRFSGVQEIQPMDLLERIAGPQAAQQGPVQLIDVREPAEFAERLGHVAGARLLPLPQLMQRVGEIDRVAPVVLICRSGARSAQAAVLLGKAGFTRVANLAGGMLRWCDEGLPVEGANAG